MLDTSIKGEGRGPTDQDQKQNANSTKIIKVFDVYGQLQVSFFSTCQDNKPESTRTVGDVLKSFVQGNFKKQIDYLRTLPEDKYKVAKATLPGITFAATFSIRNKDLFETLTGLMSVDFDKIDKPEQFRDELKSFPFIYSAWVSPSKKGVKALLPIPYVENDAEYKVIFKQVQKVLPGIDGGCNDLTRLCFACYDPGLWTNPTATIFELQPEQFEEVRTPQPVNINGDLTPWKDFDDHGELEPIVEPIGWTRFKVSGPNEHWCRPGKTNSTSATWHREKRLFYNFSSNVQGLEPGKAYSLSALYALLNCGGDFKESGKQLREKGFGSSQQIPTKTSARQIPHSSNARPESPDSNLFRLSQKLITMQQPKKLFGPLWAEGENAFLFAEDGAGKSILAVQVACSIGTGQNIPGFQIEVPPQPVAVFDAELSDFQFYNRYPGGLPDNFFRFAFNDDQQSALVKADIQFVVDQLEKAATAVNAKILILDNLAALTSMIDATKTSDAIRLMGLLNEVKKKGFSILIIDHCRKPMKETEFKTISKHDLQGSKMKTNLVDSVFSIGKSCQGENYRYIKALKIRSYEMAFTKSGVATMYLKPDPLRLEFLGLDPEWTHVNDRSSQINKMASEGKSQTDIALQFGISQPAVSKHLTNYDKL